MPPPHRTNIIRILKWEFPLPDHGFVPSLSASGGSLSRILKSSHSGIYALLIVMMSMFLFSCQKEEPISVSLDKIPITAEDGYLVFEDIEQVKDYLMDRDKYTLPDGFMTLTKKLNIFLKEYSNDGVSVGDLSNYYKLIPGHLPRVEFKFRGFAPILNTDHIVKVGENLLKFDFDELKSTTSSSVDAFDKQNYEIVKTTSTRKFNVKLETRDWEHLDIPCGTSYMDMQELYGNIFAFIGINSVYPLSSLSVIVVEGAGGSISYYGYSKSIAVEGYQIPSSLVGEKDWTQLIGNAIAPCGSRYVTLHLDKARLDWIGLVNPENDYCEGLNYYEPGNLSQYIDGCD